MGEDRATKRTHELAMRATATTNILEGDWRGIQQLGRKCADVAHSPTFCAAMVLESCTEPESRDLGNPLTQLVAWAADPQPESQKLTCRRSVALFVAHS
jgi:hypothetical protein